MNFSQFFEKFVIFSIIFFGLWTVAIVVALIYQAITQ